MAKRTSLVAQQVSAEPFPSARVDLLARCGCPRPTRSSARLVAALAVGIEMIALRRILTQFHLHAGLGAALMPLPATTARAPTSLWTSTMGLPTSRWPPRAAPSGGAAPPSVRSRRCSCRMLAISTSKRRIFLEVHLFGAYVADLAHDPDWVLAIGLGDRRRARAVLTISPV